MIHYDIESYLQAKQDHENTLGRIIDGNGFYFYNGEWVTDKVYFKAIGGKPVYEHELNTEADHKNFGFGVVPYKSSRK